MQAELYAFVRSKLGSIDEALPPLKPVDLPRTLASLVRFSRKRTQLCITTATRTDLCQKKTFMQFMTIAHNRRQSE